MSAALRVLQSAWSALWPAACPLCNEIPDEPLSGSFCPRCSETFVAIREPFCLACGRRLNPGSNPRNKVCARCATEPHAFDLARSYGNYEGALSRGVIDFKFHRKRELLEVFSPMMSRTAAQAAKELRIDLVVPVPLHPARIKERGFNQAADLARAASAGTGRPLSHGIMQRVRNTGQQTGMTRAQRKRNVKGAFKVRRPDRVKNKNLLLVDDVMTTGATLDECARELKKAGAARVAAVTLARAP